MTEAVATLTVEEVELVTAWLNLSCCWCYERGLKPDADEIALAEKLGITIPTEEECL